MQKPPASAGWTWVKEGFALFRQQPAELCTLFMGYMFLMFAIGVIPVLGQLLPLVLVPIFSMAFMQACVQVERKERVYPTLLLTGFRSPAMRPLLLLGVLYLLAAVLAIAASVLIDGGVLWKIISGKLALDDTQARDANLTLAMLFAAIVYTPLAMAFWYAAPLVMWKGMGVGQALFYSFFAVLRASKAFLVYGLAWIVLGIVLPSMVSALFILLGGKLLAVTAVLLVTVVLTVVMYCSFYPTYTAFFGKPGTDSVVEQA
jgi:hypothetical protein